MMVQVKRIYILIIKVNKLILKKEIENWKWKFGRTREKLWKHLNAACVPTAFLILPNFQLCFYNSIETQSMFSISWINISLVLTYIPHTLVPSDNWCSTIWNLMTQMSPRHDSSPSTETCIEKHCLQCKSHPCPIFVWPKESGQTHNQHLYLPPCNHPQY